MESSDAISAFNPALTRYAAELFDFFGIANKLPQKLVKPADVVGHISYFSRLAEGRLKGTPVAAGGGDQMTGLLGNGITKKGLLGLNYGASGVVTAYDEGNHSDPKGRIHYFGDWLMACCMATGLSVDKWVEETGKSVEQIMQEAAAVPAGANGVRFYPWANGINHPVKAANTTARFVNRSSAEDLNSRAVIEGVALEMVLCAKMMKDFGLKFDMARIGGGGAKDETGLIPQTFADMLGIPVTVNEETEASSLGAAVAAAVAAGVYSSTAEACDAMVHGGKVFEPNKDNFALYEEMARQYYAQVAQDYPDAWARHNG